MLNYLCLVVFSRAINSNNAASYVSTAPLGYEMPIETKNIALVSIKYTVGSNAIL